MMRHSLWAAFAAVIFFHRRADDVRAGTRTRTAGKVAKGTEAEGSSISRATPLFGVAADTTRMRSTRRYLACIALAGLLTACTQAQSLRDTVATGYYVGDTSVEDAAACVSSDWSKKPLPVNVVPLLGGTSIQLSDGAGGKMVALVDVLATGATTTAKYYSKPGVDSSYSDTVMDCLHATSSIQ